MNCSEAKRLLSACVDRDLTFEQEEQLRQHLRACTECAQEMAGMEQLQALLRGLPETQPSADFYEAVCQRIEAARANPTVLSARPRFSLGEFVRGAFASAWLRPAAGVALGLAIGLLVNTGSAPERGLPGVPDGNLPVAAVETDGSGEDADARVADPAMMVASSGSPLADLDLSHLVSSDSTHVEEEYILEPFETDSQGRPVRPRMMQRVSGDQDVYITF